MALLTLTTDFGEGAYVGQVKGVILSLFPGTRIVDVTHAVAPGDVREAAYLLEAVVPAFPEGSVHLAVVDPGVGTERKALALRFADRIVVAPDNGILTAFLPRATEVREITERSLFLPEISPTFHGRDIFAPVAAHLANGLELTRVGPPPTGEPVVLGDLRSTGEEGVVLHVDRFGNLITSFPAEFLLDSPEATLSGPGAVVTARAETYGFAPPES